MRHEKPTKLVASMQLRACLKTCRCQKGHEHFAGYDKEKRCSKTAGAAAYSKKFCKAVCKDVLRQATL
eukprot:2168701-Lingulodinium_polyedra.AAC.1